MLTGFDSKWVNTIYLDKVMEYENLIQAFSRTNRLFNESEKPFGIIKYYRRPNTMEKNIEAAVEAYSGNVPTGLFVDKLPRNLRNLNRTFEEIKEIFDAGAINNFEKLPDEQSEKRKFAKAFNQFDTYLQAAKIQGFNWKQRVYSAEDGTDIEMLFDEMTYLILLARYKEMAGGGGGGHGGDVSFRTLKSVTGLDNTTVSNMKKGKNLTKENVVSCCLGIHIPFRLSNRLLQLAERPLDLTLPGAKGEENTIYDQILHLYWAEDYSDTYAELVAIHYEHLIHQPPIK